MGLEDINPNRGLVQRPLPNGGPLISMCKTVPGVYFDANGLQVSDDLAASAGFDVAGDKRTKAKNEAIENEKAKIEAKFAEEAAKVDRMSDAELEEKGLVEPGSLTPDPVTATEPKDLPFITKTSTGEPRVARTVPGGIVKIMEYDQKAQGWTVKDRDSGKVLGKKLDKEAATELLLAE